MNVGRFCDRENLGDHDFDVVRSDARRHDRNPKALVHPGHGRELAIAPFQFDRTELGGDPGRPIRVTGEEHVLGQLAWTEVDVVLPLPNGECDAVVRVRQARLPLCALCAPRRGAR